MALSSAASDFSKRVPERSHSMATRRKTGKRSGDDSPRAFTRQISRLDASRAADSTRPPKGRLILIGGAEDRQGEMTILKQVAARARGGRLAVITTASSEPAQMFSMYRRIFEDL